MNTNDTNNDNVNMWVIYGIAPSTGKDSSRYYITARTAESALLTFWSINARDLSIGRFEWIVEVYIEARDTQCARCSL